MDFRAILDKHGPMAVALAVLIYLLQHQAAQAERDRAFFFNEVSQQIHDRCEVPK